LPRTTRHEQGKTTRNAAFLAVYRPYHMPLVVEIERVWIFSATRDRLLTKDMIYPWFVRDGSEVVVYCS
jgi:hypothetical protein